jgi:hypothetical protein
VVTASGLLASRGDPRAANGVKYVLNLVRSRYPDKLKWYVNFPGAGESAISYAAFYNLMEVVELLLPMSDWMKRDSGFNRAADHASWDMVQLFINHGVSDGMIIHALDQADENTRLCGKVDKVENRRLNLIRGNLVKEAEKRGLAISQSYYEELNAAM